MTTLRTRVLELNDRNFESATAHGLVLVFFWEQWESGCRREWKLINEAGEVVGEQVRIGRCSVEDYPELAERLAVRSIPTTIIFRDGKEEERLVGLRHERTLIKHLRKHLEKEA